MFCFRPVQMDDLDAICDMAKLLGPGFASLPDDRHLIEAKIARSVQSFQLKVASKDRLFFFVLEESGAAKKPIGTAAIEVAVGGETPFYMFSLETVSHVCSSLKKNSLHPFLCFSSYTEQASLLCTLFLRAEYRGEHRGTFLSRARCLFIAEFSDLFSNTIVANMRGVFDANSISPFWETVMRPFFDMDLNTANYLAPTRSEEFIASLAPKHPIYLDLLNETVRTNIGKTHDNTKPALHVLEKEGLQFKGHIDILDSGPLVECHQNDLKTVKESKRGKFAGLLPSRASGGKENEKPLAKMMICNTKMEFRAVLASLKVEGQEQVYLEPEAAKLLALEQGDELRYCPIK